jgi:hypothetical protein
MDEQQILKNITPEINSTIRHGVTMVAGALAAHGVLVPDSLQSQIGQTLVSGVLFSLVLLWSYVQKHLQKVQVIQALNTPVPGGK